MEIPLDRHTPGTRMSRDTPTDKNSEEAIPRVVIITSLQGRRLMLNKATTPLDISLIPVVLMKKKMFIVHYTTRHTDAECRAQENHNNHPIVQDKKGDGKTKSNYSSHTAFLLQSIPRVLKLLEVTADINKHPATVIVDTGPIIISYRQPRQENSN